MSDFSLTDEEVDVPLELEGKWANLLFEDGGTVFMEHVQVMQSASDGIPPGQDFEGSRRCAQCGFLFKYSDLVYFRGRYYGKPCGDYKDIASILRGEAAQRQTAQSREQQRSR